MVVGYGEIGQRIYEDISYQKYGKGNQEFNLRLFTDIGIGKSTGYYCLEFYERKIKNKFQVVSTAVETLYTKDLTWTGVKGELPEPKENKIVILIPSYCNALQ